MRMRGGFTLIELLIVLAILAAMAFVAVPSFDSLASTQVSMAAKDTLRLMRYARNMALQTQQPVLLDFAPGEIRVRSAFDSPDQAAAPAQTDKGASQEGETQGPGRDAVVAGDVESVGLTRRYANVAFALVGYDDSILQGRSAGDRDRADFNRRRPGQDAEEEEARGDWRTRGRVAEEERFTITVRANGTTRPFTLRVRERETESAGDTIAFDFLCSGVIGDE